MTDDSPRLRAALRYMVYGREGQFDAERLIDMLEALEKFKAIRDDGDGTAYKVDGVRGNKVIGSAGDFVGSQVVDTSERDTDIDGGRFRVNAGGNNNINIGGSNFNAQTEEDQETVREGLRFFFSKEGEPFREFMLEEIVTVVDASGREATQEILRRVGLANLPTPSFLKALNPELSDNDKRMVQQITKLVQFLGGDFDGAIGGGDSNSGNNNLGNGGNATTARLRALIPIVREYRIPLQDFGKLLVARLTEKNIQRSLNWASERISRGPLGSRAITR